MNQLRDMIWALLPPQQGVRLPRLIKEIYLVDWKCAFSSPPRPCGFQWIYGPCGPTSMIIEECIKQNHPLFRIEETRNQSGVWIATVYRCNVDYSLSLSPNVLTAINLVLEVVQHKSWEELTLLVSSTYPIMQSSMLDNIDMERFAKEYQEIVNHYPLVQDELPFCKEGKGLNS